MLVTTRPVAPLSARVRASCSYSSMSSFVLSSASTFSRSGRTMMSSLIVGSSGPLDEARRERTARDADRHDRLTERGQQRVRPARCRHPLLTKRRDPHDETLVRARGRVRTPEALVVFRRIDVPVEVLDGADV